MGNELQSLYNSLNETVIKRDAHKTEEMPDESDAGKRDELTTAQQEQVIRDHINKLDVLLGSLTELKQLNPNTLFDILYACKPGGTLHDHYDRRNDSHAIRQVESIYNKTKEKMEYVRAIMQAGSAIQQKCSEIMRDTFKPDKAIFDLWKEVMDARHADYSHFVSHTDDKIAVEYAVEFLKRRQLSLPVINDIVENAK